MPYLIVCSRCKFKVSPGKHFCPTCGLKMMAPTTQERTSERSNNQAISKESSNKRSFWSSFLGLNSNAEPEIDKTQEKPA